RQLPTSLAENGEILKQGDMLQQLITAIRDTRNKNQLKPKDTIKLHVDTASKGLYTQTEHILTRQVNAEQLNFVSEAPKGSISIVVQTDKLYIEADAANIDTGAQKEQMQKELDYLKGFLVSIEKKLGNE